MVKVNPSVREFFQMRRKVGIYSIANDTKFTAIMKSWIMTKHTTAIGCLVWRIDFLLCWKIFTSGRSLLHGDLLFFHAWKSRLYSKRERGGEITKWSRRRFGQQFDWRRSHYNPSYYAIGKQEKRRMWECCTICWSPHRVCESEDNGVASFFFQLCVRGC